MTAAVRILRPGIAVAVLLVAVWCLLPTSLGGGTTYVGTHGDSMEPRFTTGDLAILRPAGSYEVGDVVAFRSDDLRTTVMHRIVDRDGDRFVTQGDNNPWLDQERPSGEQILGELWLRVPQGGTALAALRSPGVLVLVPTAIGLVMWVVRRPVRRRRGRRTRSARPVRPNALPALPRLSTPARVRARRAAVAASGVGVVALTAAAALLVLPDEQTRTREVPVTQEGRFTYSGGALAGTTYPDGRIDTGDPVYTALAGALTVSYEHSLASVGALDTHGTVRLGLGMTAPDGWSTELAGGLAVPLTGDAATATLEIDTLAAAGLLAAHYYEVGADAGTATLVVTPEVDVEGAVDGRPFVAPAPTDLAFTLEPAALRMAGGPETLVSAGATTVSVEEVVPRTFAAGPVALPIQDARVLTLGLAITALLVSVVLTWLGGSRNPGVAEQFLQRRAGRVLPVASFVPDGTVVDVADPEALYKLAERLDGLVLHHAGPDGDTFAVRDVGTTYRCVVPQAPAVGKAPAPVRRARLLSRFA